MHSTLVPPIELKKVSTLRVLGSAHLGYRVGALGLFSNGACNGREPQKTCRPVPEFGAAAEGYEMECISAQSALQPKAIRAFDVYGTLLQFIHF